MTCGGNTKHHSGPSALDVLTDGRLSAHREGTHGDRETGGGLTGAARGFTLVELLVVIAVIIVLAAMLLPVYESATNRAEGAVCLTNLKNIVVAAHLYADDYDGFCVPARVGGGPPGTLGICWDTLLQPYLRSTLILLCPADPTPAATALSVSFPHSYGINYDIALIGGYNGAALPLSRIEQPASTVLFFDLRGAARAMGTSVSTDGLSRVDARHFDGANFAFAAGNIQWRRPETTLTSCALTARANMWEP